MDSRARAIEVGVFNDNDGGLEEARELEVMVEQSNLL
jgi:hypothetical protein